jgi:hypothetical protein
MQRWYGNIKGCRSCDTSIERFLTIELEKDVRGGLVDPVPYFGVPGRVQTENIL